MMKKRKVELPCFLCDKAGEICDKERPCGRCTRLNIPHMCIGAELTSGGINNIVKPVPSSVPQQRVTPLRAQVSASEKQTPSPLSSPQKQNLNHVNGPTSPIRPSTPSLPTQNPQSPPPSSPTVTSSKRTTETNGTILQSNTRTMNLFSGERLSNPFENNPKVHEPPNVSAPVPPYQMNINSFLMSEMKKLKEDQQRLNDEVLSLKLQNLKLTAQLDNFASALPKFSNFQLLLGGASDAQKAMVVFDLMKSPAIVLTANDTFCAMFGYTLDEVLGMPWQMFIHRDYIDKTMQILSTASVNQPMIQFEQVYVHKDGAFFSTWDTHTIFFSNGKPVSDVVFINLAPSPTDITPTTPQPFRTRNLLSLEGRPPSTPGVTTAGFSVVDTPPATPTPSSNLAYTVTTPGGTVMDTVEGNHVFSSNGHVADLLDLPFDPSHPRVESLDGQSTKVPISEVPITEVPAELPVLDMTDWANMASFLSDDFVPDSPPLTNPSPTTKQPFTFLPQ